MREEEIEIAAHIILELPQSKLQMEVVKFMNHSIAENDSQLAAGTLLRGTGTLM